MGTACPIVLEKPMLETIRAQFAEHQRAIDMTTGHLLPQLEAAARLLVERLRAGHKLLICGNGGSAADAQHFAAELVGRFRRERRGLPAVALTTDSSIVTALGNDYGFETIFRRQVEALAAPGDVVLGISTSGNSANVLQALVRARELGCATIALLGGDGGQIASQVDHPLTVSCDVTARIQEVHLTLIHILCELIEQAVAVTSDPSTNGSDE